MFDNIGLIDRAGNGIKIIPTSDVAPGWKRIDSGVNFLVHPEEYARMRFMTANETVAYLTSLKEEFEDDKGDGRR